MPYCKPISIHNTLNVVMIGTEYIGTACSSPILYNMEMNKK